jgi:hypothetical protein
MDVRSLPLFVAGHELAAGVALAMPGVLRPRRMTSHSSVPKSIGPVEGLVVSPVPVLRERWGQAFTL